MCLSKKKFIPSFFVLFGITSPLKRFYVVVYRGSSRPKLVWFLDAAFNDLFSFPPPPPQKNNQKQCKYGMNMNREVAQVGGAIL